MCEEHHDSDYQQHVNGAAIRVKGQESKQPRAVNILLSCSLAGLLNMEHATVPLPGSNEQSAILVANALLVFLYRSRQATLALPHVLTTGAGDRLRWMFLC